eukprot:gene9899-biopygen7099
MTRLRINLDDGVDPVDVGAAVEMLDQAVYAKVSPLVVKLIGFSQDGSLVGQFSGFMHGEVIVAAGHMQGFCGKDPRHREQAQLLQGLTIQHHAWLVAITAHADEGFSGGPVVDKHGRLLGVVKGALGTTIMRIGSPPTTTFTPTCFKQDIQA